MAHFPLSPRFAKMLINSEKFDCVPYICAIVCALTVPDLLVTSTWTTETEDGEEVKVTKEGLKKIGTAQFKELGDLMALLRAVGLFEQSTNPIKFCFKNGLRYKAMNEIHKMGIQLLKEMNQVFPYSNIPMTMETTPPGSEMLEIIRKICTACLIDQVARKIPHGEMQDNKNLKNAYQLMDCDEPAFIHPSSTQFERLPEYVAYSELTRTSKLYMKYVFEIDLHLLPFIAPEFSEFSSPREFPPPKYDSVQDKIYCWLDGTYGPAQWRFRCIRKEMPKGYHRYLWFCYFFLDGQVCPFIKNYRNDLLAEPSTVLKSWAMMLPRTRFIREAIMRNDVDSYESLNRVWRNNPKFLLQEFREIDSRRKYMEVELNWPPQSGDPVL
ncbi:putative ATP-dependent RNA helicase PB1A10.06c [Caerostris extrusa]|uniref:ATP-dependent RNA helicase PB1A10.06c n=1 Tax=Caerostris extrusa TaxID=172846 RepID=A0AAV4MCS6_CAEEX|nr:putative ATP-dependent RNA helicase PB1A10.06c [Caerostris extrusa]